MNDTSEGRAADANPAPGFTLESDIAIGGEVKIAAGTFIAVRRPSAGELRGLKLLDLVQFDAAALYKIAPRITAPVIHSQMAQAMDPADLMQFGTEVADFLLTSRAKAQ